MARKVKRVGQDIITDKNGKPKKMPTKYGQPPEYGRAYLTKEVSSIVKARGKTATVKKRQKPRGWTVSRRGKTVYVKGK